MPIKRLLKYCFIIITGAILISDLTAQPFDLASLIPDEKTAAEKGKQTGIGSVKLIAPVNDIEVNSFQSFTLIYKAGKAGIKPGGKIVIGMRHLLGWSPLQTGNPRENGYVTGYASNSSSLNFTILQDDWESPYFWQLFPWQNAVVCHIGVPGLNPGDSITFVIGDQSKGSRGVRVQSFDEFPFMFKFYADVNGNDDFLPIADNPYINIVSAHPFRLNIIMPSDVQAGKPTWCIVRAEDRYGNPAAHYKGTVSFQSPAIGKIPGTYKFKAEDKGVHRFNNLVFNKSGIIRMEIKDEEFTATGNPVLIHESEPEKKLFWGDLHGHTLFSDGRGTVEQFYDFAENVAGLDFCAVTDHGFELTDEMWSCSKDVTNKVHKPGRFVTFQAYEWSGMTEVGGDHNVYFLNDDPPLYRSRSYYNYQNYQFYHGSEPQINHVEDLFSILSKEIEAKHVLTIPHYGGRKGNPEWHHHSIDRNIEVFSEHRRSEDWMNSFLEKGHRLGIMASTDGHFGNPGYGYLTFPGNAEWNDKEIGMALVAVYADELSRESIFDAIHNRHVYATTGERIILNFKVNDFPMGSEINADTLPGLSVHVTGTKIIKTIHVKKNSKIIKTFHPQKISTDIYWTDKEFLKNEPCYYYIHVIQEDNEEAMSSPVWVNW